MKKTNNKGFSLVELIVVIAIMAVLVVLVAPQYTKYVERGRKSTDVQTVTTIVTACDIYQADTGNLKDDDTNTLKGGNVVKESSYVSTNTIENALKAAGITQYGLKSKEWAASGTDLVLKVDVVDGVPAYSITTTQATNIDILKGDIDATE